MVRPTRRGAPAATHPPRWAAVVLLSLVGATAACSGSADRADPLVGGTTAAVAPPATGGSGGTVVPERPCKGDDEQNQDDDNAGGALLLQAQLPAGDWTRLGTPPCPWALSADELLAAGDCRSAASALGTAPNDERRNGNARVTYVNADDVQLDNRIEIYTSRQNVDAVRAVLAEPAVAGCFDASIRARAAADVGTTVRDVQVTRAAAELDAPALGLGFPASHGFAADAGFVERVEVTFTMTNHGSSRPVAMRVYLFGAGAAIGTVTLIGTTPADLAAVDMTATLRSAAAGYRALFAPDI